MGYPDESGHVEKSWNGETDREYGVGWLKVDRLFADLTGQRCCLDRLDADRNGPYTQCEGSVSALVEEVLIGEGDGN